MSLTLLNIIPFFEIVKPTDTEIRSVLVLVLRNSRPDCLSFLSKKLTGKKIILLFNKSMPVEKNNFENRLLSLALPKRISRNCIWVIEIRISFGKRFGHCRLSNFATILFFKSFSSLVLTGLRFLALISLSQCLALLV